MRAADLELRNLRAEDAEHRGRRAVRLVETEMGAGEALAILPGEFHDGDITFWVAADRRPDAAPEMRGFAGIAFRLDGDAFERVFLRPTNGRSTDQLRRNHSTQYDSLPAWPWNRLRDEAPGVYESYVDLEPDAWTHVRVHVRGARMWLFVHEATQPCLVVNDLKLGASARGRVALWIGTGTEAFFADLVVTPA